MVKRKNAAKAAVKAAKIAAKAAHEAKVASIILHFDTTYTAKLGRLAAFQQLCTDLDVDVGTSLKQCKENVKLANINIHDFVRVQKAGGDVSAEKFPSNAALRRDIKKDPSRRFPLHRAKANVFLTAMLIDV
ncbi:hypothetical protein Q7P36_004147 [Cladosporium allicinum]